jgi:CRP-like cAMP-binding protein
MAAIETLTGRQRTLKRNEYLCARGNIDRNAYYVEQGSLRIFVLDNNEEQIIRFAYTGNLFAVLDSFFTNRPTNFYVQAIKKTTLKVIARPDLEDFLAAEEQHRLFWTKILEDLVLQQMEREVDILTASPAERYRRVLKRSPRLFQEIPGRYIANYLRMSAETLSRLKKC